MPGTYFSVFSSLQAQQGSKVRTSHVRDFDTTSFASHTLQSRRLKGVACETKIPPPRVGSGDVCVYSMQEKVVTWSNGQGSSGLGAHRLYI